MGRGDDKVRVKIVTCMRCGDEFETILDSQGIPIYRTCRICQIENNRVHEPYGNILYQ